MTLVDDDRRRFAQPLVLRGGRDTVEHRVCGDDDAELGIGL